MSSNAAGESPADPSAGDRWQVARPAAVPSLGGVAMAGYRDRTGGPFDLRVLPQPAVIVVLGLGDAPLTVDGGAGPPQPVRSLVAAPTPGAARIRGERVRCIEMRLSPPAAHTLLGPALRELDGTVAPLEDLWGKRERLLRERLADTAAWSDRFSLVNRFLSDTAARGPRTAPEVAAAWEHITARGGRVRVADLAASCGWSRKRLWSRFTAQTGLTPKRAAMLVRFDRAARALRAGADASEVASACGYADQSHLHRDVTAFAACTPAALAALP
ncbi:MULTISPECIES: helix-turn-helix domain-containing protein [Streptomyces]|uniref:helix-turn-helix domain-containing protein n=1 Tax=Streptomyces TaxID=1883 RepID=UPI0016773FD4|nr:MULTISPECIES: helix-turn-helix domain-containing protein [Streptomyces]MBD3578130.1 helix-turn-helix domain-containing protein [Streptomyces sp. KD18]GGT29546.1 AraC family transcriptional regulator [Streptomyces toxytricini]